MVLLCKIGIVSDVRTLNDVLEILLYGNVRINKTALILRMMMKKIS